LYVKKVTTTATVKANPARINILERIMWTSSACVLR
jgi:hypothetical protein